MAFDKQITIPEGYTFRPLEKTDYHNNYLDVLRVLTEVGEILESKFNELFDYWKSLSDIFHPHVITNKSGKIVAVGMVLFERKMIHECSIYAHIEDIAVAESEQGNKLGYSMIVGLTNVAKEGGCYKIILDCDPKNIGFYEKCGYTNGGNEMFLKFNA